VTEIGWHLHPDHQGQGLATESALALLAAAEDAELDQILALTDPDNVPSQAVATRLGLHDDGLTDRWFGLTVRQFRHLPEPGRRSLPAGRPLSLSARWSGFRATKWFCGAGQLRDKEPCPGGQEDVLLGLADPYLRWLAPFRGS